MDENLQLAVPTKTQLSNFLRTPGEDYFKGNPKSLNFYFLVIWWGKLVIQCVFFSSRIFSFFGPVSDVLFFFVFVFPRIDR